MPLLEPGTPVIWHWRDPQRYPLVEHVPATVVRQTTRKVTIDAVLESGVRRVSVDPDHLSPGEAENHAHHSR
jgi:hypothetical protein